MSNERSADLLIRGVAEARGGDKAQARFYLEWFLREWDIIAQTAGTSGLRYEDKATAWYWLSRVSDEPAQQRTYLESVLAVNPSHPEARRDLAILDGRLKPAEIVNPDQPLAPVAPASETVRRYVCPQCGGKLAYDVAQHALLCTYCGYQASADAAPHAIASGDFTATLYTARAHRWELAQARTLMCQSCGAHFTLPPAQLTGACPFCASAHIVESQNGYDLIEPSGVVPFQFGFEACVQHIRDWLKSREGVPDDLYEKSAIVRPRAVYLPFWVFDVGGEVRWRGVVQEPREGDGKLVWITREGSALAMQDHVLVLASHSLPASLTNALSAYDLTALAPYAEDFLVDWTAEIYQIALADASLVAHQRAFAAATQRVRHTTDARALSFDSTGIVINTYQLVLLPVWVGEVRYKDKRFPLVVNGQTGSVHGAVPRNGWRQVFGNLLIS